MPIGRRCVIGEPLVRWIDPHCDDEFAGNFVTLADPVVVDRGEVFAVDGLLGFVIEPIDAELNGLLAVAEHLKRGGDMGKPPGRNQLIDGILILISGVMMITPGLITDTAGFCLLVPAVRAQLADLEETRSDSDSSCPGRPVYRRGRSAWGT